MQILKDKPAIIIKPNKELVVKLVNELSETMGTFVLDDIIKEELANNSLNNEEPSFTYTGLYTNPFTTQAVALDFKEAIEQLVIKTNASPDAINIKHIDDVLFITLLYFSYSGIGRSISNEEIYLHELADVYVRLSNRNRTPVNEDSIWIQDVFTGIESKVRRSSLTEAELLNNDGYNAYSHIIHPTKQRIQHIPNDGKIVIQPVHANDKPIELPRRLAKHLTETMLRYIIKKHKEANTDFYNELSNRDIGLHEWEKRTKPRLYSRDNKVLSKLIIQLDRYLRVTNKLSKKAQRQVFIYDLLAVLKLIPLPKALRKDELPATYKEQIVFHRLTPIEKSSAIRTILKDNNPS